MDKQIIKSNKEWSLGKLVDQGLGKEEICKLKNLTPEAYDKAYDSLMLIRDAKRRAAESKAVTVRFEDRKGMYRIDMAHREFINTENPQERVPFDSDEPIIVTAFTCPKCESLINQLDYKEQGTYTPYKGNCGEDYVPEKTEFSCPLCHAPFNTDILRAMGAGTV